MGRVNPSSHREKLWLEQDGICAWPPCRKPLADGSRPEVDHNHLCCPNGRTCGKCVRGLVHQRCNVREIRWMDQAIAWGFDPPIGPVGDYLRIGDVNCRGESYIEDLPESALPGYELGPNIFNVISENEIRIHYPTLAHLVLDGGTQQELASVCGVTQQAIAKRARGERREFLMRYVERHGLIVVGDESLSELVEAYEYLLGGH